MSEPELLRLSRASLITAVLFCLQVAFLSLSDDDNATANEIIDQHHPFHSTPFFSIGTKQDWVRK